VRNSLDLVDAAEAVDAGLTTGTIEKPKSG